jgi:hypothetical protein
VSADIIQLLGTSSVPVIVAGSVLGIFELGEKLASRRAKDALSKWLLTFDVQKAKALPDGTQELFERIFGERHVSLKCFIRSTAFSLSAMAFISILVLLIYPQEIFEIWDEARKLSEWTWPVPMWLLWSIFIDYVSLFKTRLILRILAQKRNKLLAVAILLIDYSVYKLLFITGLQVAFWSTELILFGTTITPVIFLDSDRMVEAMTRFPDQINVGFIFFWSGFAPSLWMWLYVFTLFVTRALLRSEKFVNWLRWFLDVEKNPFRSIGAVAAALAFITSVTIILVSAEVSRMRSVALPGQASQLDDDCDCLIARSSAYSASRS